MIRLLLILLVTITPCSNIAAAGDWFFMPSTYSNSPETGERVRQYAPIPPVIVYQSPDYTRSGYRQTRSTIRAGGSIDSYHVVEQYGEDIRPYGEWLYPYRPYSTPYDAWGAPFGGVNGEHYGEAELRGGYSRDRYERDRYRGRDLDYDRDRRTERDVYDRRYRTDDRVRAERREYSRYNGLFDGRGIPGDDEHYLEQPRRLEQMDDREFYSRPRGR